MDEKELQRRIDAANEEMVQEVPETEQPPVDEETVLEVAPGPVDIFDRQSQAIFDMPKTRVRGAKKKLLLDLDQLLDNGIEEAYRKAVDDSEYLRAEGEAQRARLTEESFMQKWYRPTVDALIRLNSQEEVLAADEALATLDNFAMLPGGGKADGYTAVYVSTLYEPVAEQTFNSDAEVLDVVRRVNGLLDAKQVRSASSLASRMLESIDAGSNRATPEDYSFLQKIVLRTS